MRHLKILKVSLIFFAIFHCFSALSQPLKPVEYQLTLDINWTGSADNDAVELGANSVTDTWLMRVKFFDVPRAEQNSGEPGCSTTIYTSEMQNENFSIMISSTTSPNHNHPAAYYDALLSYDVFNFTSETGREYFSFRDRTNGLYQPETGSSLHTWILDRYLSSPMLDAGTITPTSEGFVEFLSGYAEGLKVEETFLNNTHQKSYRKTGVATVTDIQVISEHNNPIPAECHYEVIQEWNEGFTADVRIKNVSLHPIDGWQMNLEFEDLIRMDNFWNASVTGISPFFIGRNETWNRQIPAGQEVSFGFVARKAANQSSSATVKSIICR